MANFSAVIIASGRASRLGGICEHRPKCLLPFDGVPFLRYLLFWLLRNGIREIIVTGSRACNGWLIEEEIRNNFSETIKFVMEEYPRNTVHSSFVGSSEVKHDNMLLLTADNVWNVDLQEMCNRHVAGRHACSVLVTTRKNVPNRGLVKMEEETGRILSLWDALGEMKGIPASTMGFYALNTKQFLSAIQLDRDIYIERESMSRLVPEIYGVTNNKFFFDFGTPKNLDFLMKNPGLITKYFGIPRI